MTLYSLTLAIALANLRIDLNDPAGASQRWQDTDLTRALDRTIERLTAVEPDLEAIQLATVPGARAYPYPAGALWIDRLEYPTGHWPPSYPAFSEYRAPVLLNPTTALVALKVPAPGSALTIGSHTYAYTWLDPSGNETAGSAPVTVPGIGANTGVQLTIPPFPDNAIELNLYRSAANTTTPLKLLDFAFSTDTVYLDTIADAGLSLNIPTVNSTGNADNVRLELPPEQIPPDATGVLTLRYALKHTLGALGTSLPERHWDTLYKGAMSAAVDMYLANINDNFVYADGQLRDRVDDTKSVDAWRSYRDLLEADFRARLKPIQNEQVAAARFTPQWGDVPLRWERI